MLQALRNWFDNLRDKQSILRRLTKQAVRMHENVRAAGDAGPGAADGSFAQGQAQQFQQNLGQSIPLFGTALNFVQGNKRSMSSGPEFSPCPGPASSPYIPRQDHSHGYSSPPGPAPTTFYTPPPGPPPSAPPLGPPPPSSYAPSSYTPPPGPPYQAPNQSGYAPSYAAAPPFLERSSTFPFPSAPGGYGASSPPPPGPSGFPGGYGPPPGPPPSFPSYGGPPQFPQHHQHPPQPGPPYQPPYGGWS